MKLESLVHFCFFVGFPGSFCTKLSLAAITFHRFLKQVRWFTGNHHQQMGRLLTPLVNGIRVRGPFYPTFPQLQNDDRKLVFLDGEGLGHSAKEATSVSTKVTEKFQTVNMILLVDNAESPIQAASLELLKSIGSSGHGHKSAVVFTHFDQVKGDNLGNYNQKQNHVRASISNAITGLRESLGVGASVTEILEQKLEKHTFYLGGLDRSTRRIPRGFVKQMRELLELMQCSAKPTDPVDAAPNYRIDRLELALRDATDGFKNPWLGRLGLQYHEDVRKEHWGRVKALCRRIANGWTNEYNGLRPVADLIRQLQISISQWLDRPSSWSRSPETEDEGQRVVNAIRQSVFESLHELAENRLIEVQSIDWQIAFGFSGTGSSIERARQIKQVYDKAAPSISSVMDISVQEFLDEVKEIVVKAIQDNGEGIE